MSAGTARLGADGGFGWDNEFPAHDVAVPAFSMDRHKVTNADSLRLVRDGGPSPPFWRQTARGPMLRLMSGEIPLPSSWPVYATHEHATAYAAWAGAGLPSEAEFQRAAYGDDGSIEGLVGNGWEWTSFRLSSPYVYAGFRCVAR